MPFVNGGFSGIASLVVHTLASGTATGTLTINQLLQEAARPHVPGLPGASLPAGTYSFQGTVSNQTTAGFSLTGTASYTPFPTDTTDTPTADPFTLSVVLPAVTQAGSFTGTFNGVSFSGTLPATGSGSSSTSSTSSSSTGGSGTGVTTTTGASPVFTGGTRTTLTQNGTAVATFDTPAGFPAFTIQALPLSNVPSLATHNNLTLVSPYVYQITLTSPTNTSSGTGQLTIPFTGSTPATGTDLADVSDGASPFSSGAYGTGYSNGAENIDVQVGQGTLNIAYNSNTSQYGTTGYVGLFRPTTA